MKTNGKPPLAVHYVWHPSDGSDVEPILSEIRRYFARDKDKPFSRGLNIPLFFYSSRSHKEAPYNIPNIIANKNVVFIFSSKNTAGVKVWSEYVEKIVSCDAVAVIVVALDKFGLNHGGGLKGYNCIRLYEWPAEKKINYAIVFMAHEIIRHGLIGVSPDQVGRDSSIKLFLSHAKAGGTGLKIAVAIKAFIDNTNMNRFFDATEISPGIPFDREIELHIPGSTLIAIGSDIYSSRYWCQREILLAKKENCPIVAVDCLEDFEDRIFPPATNMPCVHVSPSETIAEKDVLRILISTILETIRHKHAISVIKYYQSQGWVDPNCAVLSCPVEVRQALSLLKENKTKVCYPEPPIYPDETDWHQELNIEAHTPLWNPRDKNSLHNMRIGISISDVGPDEFYNIHLHPDQLIRMAQDLARHLLARSSALLYGGDLRKDGFTEFILEEASALKERIQHDLQPVENHLAWPLYISGPDVVAWRAKYRPVMKTVEHLIPKDITKCIDKSVFISPVSTQNKYIWSRCLTEMREKSIYSSNARICAGGKLSGYRGKMPGVLEEIIISLKQKKPIYLLGAFNGVTGKVCNTIINGLIADELTESWQITHNDGYFDLLSFAHSEGHKADYNEIKEVLELTTVDDLANRAGLSMEDYTRLMLSPFVDECVHIVIKGLNKIAEIMKK